MAFEHLEVPNRRDEDLTADEIERWVLPFYLSHHESFKFVAGLRRVYGEVDEAVAGRLLSFLNWRPKVAGAYFAAMKKMVGLEPLIGRLLLRSDVCYAGSTYCVALATFATDESRRLLREYLDYYLTTPENWYDQKEAIGALAYLDPGAQEEYRERWDAFAADKSWSLDEAVGDFARLMESLKGLVDGIEGRRETHLRLVRGDITAEKVDVVVNAANSSLMGGGGVDGAIHRAGGAAILEECRLIVERDGECPTGQAVITTGGKLPARHVIHTVGPVWRGGDEGEPELLASCYHRSLLLAYDTGASSVAFPCISTGVYGYPAERAAPIAVETVRAFVERYPGMKEIRFVVFGERDHQLYERLLG